MIIVTGGAGCIGSAIVWALNKRGISDIVLVDGVEHPEKKKNIASLNYFALEDKEVFLDKIRKLQTPWSVDAIIHLGGCSSTIEKDETFLTNTNFNYTKYLATYALNKGIRFIYASSAATYGSGGDGFSDEVDLEILKPLNPYGHSKHKFDLWAQKQGVLDQIAGLKYFNVFGPGEYHKKEMQSMVRRGFLQVLDSGKIRLFKSHNPDYADGDQQRDFLYIKDAIEMTLFFLDNPKIGGIFNAGTGVVRTWNDLAANVFKAMGRNIEIEYVDMPPSIRDQFQYRTCAKVDKIRNAGYSHPITSLEDATMDYIQNYLLSNKRL
jgi:ADP-L-glycero-D-manno-heptose 6-epimerase